MFNSQFSRFLQKKIGKNVFIVGQNIQQLQKSVTQLHNQTRKYQRRQTMYDDQRLLQPMYKGWESNKYWTDTIRHYDQKKVSFFVTNILAKRKISVPLR